LKELRQTRVRAKNGTLARPEWVPTPARGNQKNGISFVPSKNGRIKTTKKYYF